MIDDILAGIAAVLETVCGGPVFYDSDAPPDLSGPYFFIDLLEAQEVQMRYPRFHRSQTFDIRYVPRNGSRLEMHGMAEGLYCALGFIAGPGGGRYHGTKMRHEIRDGALHFCVNFDLQVRHEREPEPNMEEMCGTKMKTN